MYMYIYSLPYVLQVLGKWGESKIGCFKIDQNKARKKTKCCPSIRFDSVKTVLFLRATLSLGEAEFFSVIGRFYTLCESQKQLYFIRDVDQFLLTF